ncbi:MAG: TIGR01777 family protein, partial [Methanobacteriota archaeon]
QVISETILATNNKPQVLLQASATGYYGSRGEETLTESSPAGEGFMAEVVKQWEGAVSPVKNTSTRVVYLRTGVVLGKESEFIKRLKLPFQFFVGGPPGDGSQWISWIHIEDEVAAVQFLIENDTLEGPINLVAPHPVQMKQFCKVFGKVLHRPSWISVPGIALKTIFGEFADEAILSSQKVVPERLLKAGFQFKYPELEEALKECLT